MGYHHRFDLSLCFVSFGFLSLGQHTIFYLSSIIGSFGFSSSLWNNDVFNQTSIFVPLISHPLETILLSILVYSRIGTPLYVLSKLNYLFVGTPSYVLSQFILCSFGFSSLGHHPRYYLSLLFLVSHHQYTVLGFISIYSLFLWISSLVSHSRFYLRLIVCSLRLITLGSIYVSSLFISFLIIGTLS